MSKPALVSLAALILASTACLGSAPPPPTQTEAPPPTLEPQSTATAMPPAPAQTSLSDQRKAMRAGFEDEAETYGTGLHYWVTLGVQTDPVRVTGHEKLHYVNRTGDALKDAVFRLFLNGLGDQKLQDISAVSVDGQSLKTETSVGGSVVKATLPRDLPAGDSMDFEIDFSMTMGAGMGVKYGRVLDLDGEITLSSFLPLIAVYGPGGWSEDAPVAQGDPAYSEVGLFDVMLTTPSDYQVASTGVVLGETKNSDGTTLRTIVSGPVRDFSVAISKGFHKVSNTRDGITVNVWGLPGKADVDQAALAKAEAALSVYNQEYGPYPFNEFDVVDSPISAGGIEYPGIIYVASNIWDTSKLFFEVVIAHETAHQWWYSMVGNDQILQPWLDESLADYSEEVYYSTEYGSQAAKEVRNNFQQGLNSYLAQNKGKDMPVGLPVGAYDEQQYSVFVYYKGPLFYSQLADKYGDDSVIKLLKTYYTQYRYRIAHTSDMERLVTEMFGPDAKKLFDQMILGQS